MSISRRAQRAFSPCFVGYLQKFCSLAVNDKTREPFVHVILVVTMKEGRAWIVGNEVDLRRREARQADRVLHQGGHGFTLGLCHLESMPMHVNRVFVAAMVLHDEPIASALRDGEQGLGGRP